MGKDQEVRSVDGATDKCACKTEYMEGLQMVFDSEMKT